MKFYKVGFHRNSSRIWLDNEADLNTAGFNCTKPYNCSFKEYCWKDIPEYSVFNIPGLYLNKKEELYKKKIITIEDFQSSDYKLKQQQQDYTDSYNSQKPIINVNTICINQNGNVVLEGEAVLKV